MVFHINLFSNFKVEARENQSWTTNYAWRQLWPMVFIFLHFFIILHFITFNQPSSILKSLFWEKQKGVKAAESGNKNITEKNTEENEKTEDSTEAEDEKMVRDNFSTGKTLWNVDMFVHPKTMSIYIIFLPMQDDQFLEKCSFSCNAKNVSHFFNSTPFLTFFSLANDVCKGANTCTL